MLRLYALEKLIFRLYMLKAAISFTSGIWRMNSPKTLLIFMKQILLQGFHVSFRNISYLIGQGALVLLFRIPLDCKARNIFLLVFHFRASIDKKSPWKSPNILSYRQCHVRSCGFIFWCNNLLSALIICSASAGGFLHLPGCPLCKHHAVIKPWSSDDKRGKK